MTSEIDYQRRKFSSLIDILEIELNFLPLDEVADKNN
jgi:hypothetical protein